MTDYQAPDFLVELLKAKSPSGAEAQAQAVYDRFVKPHADDYANADNDCNTGSSKANAEANCNPGRNHKDRHRAR